MRGKSPLRLECGPCALRPWRESDIGSLQRHANSRAVWLNLRDRFPHPYTLTDARLWVTRSSGFDPPRDMAIEVEGEACGAVGLEPGSDVERCSAEVGYWLGEAFWGRGIASAALRRFTDYAFDTFPLTRLFAPVFLRNGASIRVLKKTGYVREGVLRRSAIKDGVLLDQALYAAVRETLPQRGGGEGADRDGGSPVKLLRKQYYFRRSGRGLLSWDVDRLLRLSSHLPRKRVKLSDIRELDENLFGDEESPTWRAMLEHMRLMDEADLSFPIILSANGAVMDGMHRVAKAVRQGRTEIEAVQFEEDPEPNHVGLGPEELTY